MNQRIPFAPLNSRHGLALPLAICAIVLIGATVAAAYFGASQRNRIATTSLSMARVVAAADLAQNITWSGMSFSSVDTLAIAASTLPVRHTMPGNAEALVKVTRLQSNLWLLLTESSVQSGSGGLLSRSTGLLFRFDSVAIDSAGTSVVQRVPVRVNFRPWLELF